MRRSSSFALFLTLAVVSPATAQTPIVGSGGDQSEEAKQARAFQNLRVPGKTVRKAVRKIRKLKWHSSLSSAKRSAKRYNKPILWIQALGRLKSYT